MCYRCLIMCIIECVVVVYCIWLFMVSVCRFHVTCTWIFILHLRVFQIVHLKCHAIAMRMVVLCSVIVYVLCLCCYVCLFSFMRCLFVVTWYVVFMCPRPI